jgi:4-diphosphocytidyl-2-C-methyl-D-erythritol kinase
MPSLKLFSPAKINLNLKILGIRPDNYHEISTLMQAISLGDILTLTIDTTQPNSNSIECENANVPTNESNLIIKAANLFRAKTQFSFSFHVKLEKRVPMEAGLGGGSSNAATAIWGLNELFGKIVSEETLSEWSAEIGSDIPFFFSTGTAVCKGRGELVVSTRMSHTGPLWIVKPSFGLSTKVVYDHYRSHFIHDNEDSQEQFHNDLEKSAFILKPELKQMRDELLKAGFKKVLMSGSGTALFCIGETDSIEISDIFCQPASFISRQTGEWYKLPL